ncbi:LysE family translocator [Microbacterium azadirachtae]|uniref:LysE family translocator n=1 Tax=Microbacterium azadirachtae TaxID=582680 RepID=UPI003F75708E
MPLATVTGFWGVALLLIMTPGADWAYTIAAGLRQRSILPSVGGLIAGHAVVVMLVAGGVGALVAGMPVVLTMLTVGGALYLVWLGVSMARQPSTPQAADQTAAPVIGQFARGMGISGLNPKVLLLLVTLLPQFVTSTSPWPVAAQILVLGAMHILTCAAVYLVVGAGARHVLATRPELARIVGRMSGVLVAAIGIFLLCEQIFTAFRVG